MDSEKHPDFDVTIFFFTLVLSAFIVKGGSFTMRP